MRTLLVIILVIVLAITAIGAMLYMAYGISDQPPAVVRVAGLGDSSFVQLHEDGTATVRAESREDAYAALGYLHGQEHAWSMALWRQTALGTLSEWFGSGMLPLDRLARRLRLARFAEDAYNTLPVEERRVLEAYSQGVSAAFALERTRLANEFVSLETTPAAWKPWHSLAIERLFSWLAAERPDADSLQQSPPAVRDFFESDRLLRSWLHLHGFENGVMWSMQDSSGTRLVQRHVYGASALPIYQIARLAWPGDSTMTGATLIGTPFMPVGRTESHAWGVLFSSRLELARAARDTSAIPVVYDRLRTTEGKEYLLRVRGGAEDIFFPALPRPLAGLFEREDTTAASGAVADTSASEQAVDTTDDASGPNVAVAVDTSIAQVSGWALQWSGFQEVSDASAWMALSRNETPSFSLFEGDGMRMTRDGAVRVQGTPSIVVPVAGGQFIGNTKWSEYAAQRVDSLSEPDVTVEMTELISDRQSAWAARLAPPLTEAAIAVPEQPHLVTEALTYLRNWDFAYDRASIAASIFDRWMAVYQDSLGHLPGTQVADSMLTEHLVRYETLVRTVAELAGEYGEDPSTWRWEIVEPQVYHFPAWSADTLVVGSNGVLSSTRYAPIELPGAGHPTTLAFGPSPLAGRLDSPAIWEAWISTNDWESFRYRHRRFTANRFFGRYLVSDRIPEPAVFAETEEPVSSVQLIPR